MLRISGTSDLDVQDRGGNLFIQGTSQARRRQLRASSGGSSDATSKASFPLHNTEARQHRGNLDVTSDVVLSCCCCCPSAGADYTIGNGLFT